MKEDTNNIRVKNICFVVSIVGIIIAAVILFMFFREEQLSEKKVEVLRMETIPADAADTASGGEACEEADFTKEEQTTGNDEVNPYMNIFEKNDDCAAWLVVDGTVIDYPVMQTPRDENYYLNRDFDGNDDKAGCLILDTDSDISGESSTNLIIHGHNMKAGTMFGSLDEYESEDYFKKHRYIELYTQYDKRNYEIIAVFKSQIFYETDIVFKYYNFFEAEDEQEFEYFYNNIKSLSLYDTGVEAVYGNNFITLSTCAYHVEDGRFVVVAKEINREVF